MNDPAISHALVDPASFEVSGDVATLRVCGEHTLDEAVDLVTFALLQAKEQRADKLLVDLTRITGFDPPSLGARHEFVGEWARAGRGHMRMAMVLRPEFVDPEKFCVILAANLGLSTNMFISETLARAWLTG